jgi:cytochrome c oxidase subunit 2
MKQIPASLWTLLAGIVVTLISLWVGQHHNLLPEQASEQAPLVDGFFSTMLTIGVALFLVVEGAILLFTIKFRRRAGDDSDGVPIEGNFSLEILWTSIPALIVVGLGVYSVEVYQQMGGFSPSGMSIAHAHPPAIHAAHKGSAIAAPLMADASAEIVPSTAEKPVRYGIGTPPEELNQTADLVVNVTGLQFAWIFEYPNLGITSGELHIPVGKDVLVNLTAQDVIHSFWVPQFRLKQDAMPGMKTDLRFVATKTGTYPIVCTELCGSYHGSMRSQVIVHDPTEFEQWITENRVAQSTSADQVAFTERTDREFLAPYAEEMGITSEALAQLHAHPVMP